MLLHVKRARVEGEALGPESGDAERGCGQKRGHEVADRESSDLNCDLCDDERLRAVSEELVEKGEEGAGEKTQEPHTEGPYRSGRVVGVGYGETNLLDGREFIVFHHLACHPLFWIRAHGVRECLRDVS